MYTFKHVIGYVSQFRSHGVELRASLLIEMANLVCEDIPHHFIQLNV